MRDTPSGKPAEGRLHAGAATMPLQANIDIDGLYERRQYRRASAIRRAVLTAAAEDVYYAAPIYGASAGHYALYIHERHTIYDDLPSLLDISAITSRDYHHRRPVRTASATPSSRVSYRRRKLQSASYTQEYRLYWCGSYGRADSAKHSYG